MRGKSRRLTQQNRVSKQSGDRGCHGCESEDVKAGCAGWAGCSRRAHQIVDSDENLVLKTGVLTALCTNVCGAQKNKIKQRQMQNQSQRADGDAPTASCTRRHCAGTVRTSTLSRSTVTMRRICVAKAATLSQLGALSALWARVPIEEISWERMAVWPWCSNGWRSPCASGR
jgi:hypothetical protein